MVLPPWLVLVLALGTLAAVALGLALWSSRAQRYTRVRPGDTEQLPGVLGAVQGLTEGWLVEGNRVELFEDGDGFYPALLDEIDRAETSIHLEIYAWWRGEICRELANALSAARRRGVEVRLLLDALGSVTADPKIIEGMERAGCRVAWYHDFKLRTFGRLNKRTHRKLAIFDGRRGWVFGHGIAEEWEGRGDVLGSWRDLAARVTGPVVSRIQSVFAQNWMEETAEILAAERYFPTLEPAGDVPIHVVSSSPRGGVSSSSLLYRLMIGAARRDLVVQNPYFAPNDEVVHLLCDAARRGVRVRILVPGPVTDARVVQSAGHFHFEMLLEAGVEIYEFQPTLNHQKVMIVDRWWSYLGSANFDERSFDINAEAGLGMLDVGVAERLLRLFAADLERSDPVRLDAWRRRPTHKKWLERLSNLVHDQI